MRGRFASQGTLQIEQGARQRSMRARVLSFQVFRHVERRTIVSYRCNDSALEVGLIAHLLFSPRIFEQFVSV
ncbi:hypothetical protein SG09_17300 [Bradyrhizobium ottawaense]|jgi:hypothetical protein|uniref:Uncharacterized protein n=1 Tax=Bradyrhizobium diazoefficiens TaxID=1355477 RepID=A0A809Z4K5_9BRAD|nr:hypothetical protein SG09_17300 [Bradyrhizobium ottawaense]BCA00903.1 hypothetical protein H12S4_18070 [Bradyrhizobium diazoefficiens]GEC50938.1 hypothetical protein BJA01nite_85800 [Bradyrhizobium japonicum]BCA08068.1 hypothetical protein H12S4_89720 [Bradyrhizobium diazoefficiens]BCE19144.1 hypothetical protein XF1B_18250 [Bradyrhizobium diazoefficiens]